MASSAQVKEFIARIAPIIQEEAKARGYKLCSPIIAQAIIESGADTSLLAYKFHNYFGMKCGSSWKGTSVNLKTKEEYNSKLVSIRDNFRTYPDMISGVKGYFDFINTKRYANLKTAETPEEYLKRIKEDGYATSSRYVQTNMDCVKKYDLEKWDWIKPIPQEEKTIDDVAREVIAGKWGNGSLRRKMLRVAGYNPALIQARVNELLKQ
jgi:flagellum-specific peptidoglycan hydrolase FlgJ